MTVKFALLFAATAASVSASAAEPENREIVVIGQSLKDTEKALADCIARGCPPNEEIRVAIAHAENQFIAGDYRDAKSTLSKTAGRNRKFGKQYPVEVSDLFRASSRVAEHLGEADQFRLSVLDMRDTLRDGLPEGDPRAMVAQIEVGDSRSKLGYPKEAIRIYKDVSEKALKAGHIRVGTYASLRQMLLEYAIAKENDYKADMEKSLAGLRLLAANPAKEVQDFGLVAAVTLARLDRDAGNTASTAEIVRRFAEKGGAARPILLSSTPIKIPESLDMNQRSGNVLTLSQGNVEGRWIDVGFWINANGLVSDTEILRASGESRWAKLVLDSIKSRIYAPLKSKGETAPAGFYMVERYSFTARYLDEVTGTRIQQRSPVPRIERLDITPENYDQPFASEAKGRSETSASGSDS